MEGGEGGERGAIRARQKQVQSSMVGSVLRGGGE